MPHGVAELVRLGFGSDWLEPGRANGVGYLAGDAFAFGRFPCIDGVDFASGIERCRLDEALLTRAAAAGAEVRQASRVKQLNRAGTGWNLDTSGGTLRADAVVVADGLRSRLRGQAGLASRRLRRQRYAAVAHVDGPVDHGQAILVALERGHEVYLTPLEPQRTLVAVITEAGSLPGGHDALDRWFDQVVGASALATRVGGALRREPVQVTGPFGVWVPNAVTDGLALVGDAAGFADPLTGEGISTGLQAARQLSGVLVSALGGAGPSREALAPYERWRREHRRDHWRLATLLLALARSSFLEQRAITAMAAAPLTFERLLAVNCGVRSLGSLPLGDWRRLLAGV
jgi:flavin-dependent dehydrogenase